MGVSSKGVVHMVKVIKTVDKVFSIILPLMVGFLTVGVIGTVFLRYLFSISFGWLEEFLTMAFVEIVFIGSAVCIREHQHIAISMFVDKLPEKKKRVADMAVMIVIALVSVVMLIYSINWIYMVGGTISPTSGIRKGVYYITVPISAFFSIFYAIVEIVGNFVSIPKPETGYQSDDAILKEESAK